MVAEIRRRVCDGHFLKWLVAAGLAWLEHNQERVNQMNVFPVPDGDTGTNMRLTMVRAYREIAQLDEKHVGIVSDKVAFGALNGARGNSGVILSQLLRGFADGLQGHDVFDAPLFLRACQFAVEKGYKAVVEPVEGTILTVAREAVASFENNAKPTDDLGDLLDQLLEAARQSLSNTPNLLPVLKNAGVVDSGGQGLVFILEGMSRLMHGLPVDLQADESLLAQSDDWQSALVPDDEEGYGYDVQFLMKGEQLDVAQVRADIDAMGWSTLVVGDANLIKVHVHVFDPGEPISYAIKTGASIDDVVVENMQEQYQHYVEDRVIRESHGQSALDVESVGVIAVANGEGLVRLFKQELQAAIVIEGGQTMNPSAEDFLHAIEKLPNNEIILLPNNKNIVMAAKQAASLAHRNVKVIPTVTMPQGIAAMLAYLDHRDAGDFEMLRDAMRDSMAHIKTLEVTIATRDATINEIAVREGQFIGLVDGDLVLAGDDLEIIIHDLLLKAGADEIELVTLYYGAGVNEAQAQILTETLAGDFPALEFVVVAGGQPLYPYIISVE
ncbi:MAG: DAK2 domain-containing protein [Aggregatilineales bacterium]